MEINKEGAFNRYVKPSILEKGLQFASRLEIKNKFHMAFITTNGIKFYILFKRDKFGSYANQFKNEKSVGESINVPSMYEAIDRNFNWIMIVYDDGKIYVKEPKEWKAYADKHQTYRTVIKKYFKKEFGKEIEDKEVTASVKIKELIRWNLHSQLSENTESSET